MNLSGLKERYVSDPAVAAEYIALLEQDAAEMERLRYVLQRLTDAAASLSNHDKEPGFRRTHAHWSRLHEGIRQARAALRKARGET